MNSFKTNHTTPVLPAIARGIEILNNGGIIAIPTETVYGLAANAFSIKAVAEIFRLKQRPAINPLIVHIASLSELATVAVEVPPLAMKLAEAFWPGPLTLVLKKTPLIPDIVTAGKPTVAVRVPGHRLALELLNRLDYPLAAPSANTSGSISPTNPSHVTGSFGAKAPYILDGGNCERGVESTIIGFTGDEPVVYRYGAIPIEAIEKICGKIKTHTSDDVSPAAPGMLSKHYAPKTRTLLTADPAALVSSLNSSRTGLLLFDRPLGGVSAGPVEILSPTGDLAEAARNLYPALHRLDAMKLDVIIAERVPSVGIGMAINDRLKRASTDESV
ncbi:L-threonylcarbamoyladenylate synthase [Mucilaginibacter flavidus]|uniref:L-threonylcarbamoyladenylate synthase n=1 Tax=Mucilaginibacter flavidus TaxID=2949309 RepID=UPI002093FDCB|nr:L-threonylcarbamoyladenylate synthase [Mucilaginibacter flavidus]MCO5947993.1 L-threonylcarbamoyladenylate synthase [Mucilaginibacter flavidus]